LTQSDARLVAFAQAGHERAYEALVKRYRRPLLGYCRRLLLSEERAEDALQQAFLQAWLALRAGTEVGDVKSWLYRIVHNAALNVLRVSGYDYCKLSESLSGADAPEADLDRRIAVREALAGLAALPEMQREALLRTAVEGRTHQQVAKDLGLSENALRGLVYRARSTMRAAAGAITPSPLVTWALASGGRGTPVIERLAEISAGGGSAGLAGLLLKGGAVAVTASALAGGIVAGHSHPHATATTRHSELHIALHTRSSSKPIVARTAPSSTWAPAAHTQHEQQPAHGRGLPARRGVLRPRHITRQPSSVTPAVTVSPPPVPVTSNEPKTKIPQGPPASSGGDRGEARGQSSNGPTYGGATTNGHATSDRTHGQGEKSSDNSDEAGRDGSKDGGSPGENGSHSNEGRSAGQSSSEGNSKGSFSPDERQGGDSQSSSHEETSASSPQHGESHDPRDSPEASPPSGTNSSSKYEHGSASHR
jgi:RNA polymerase sigma factor (sigma-70 family)